MIEKKTPTHGLLNRLTKFRFLAFVGGFIVLSIIVILFGLMLVSRTQWVQNLAKTSLQNAASSSLNGTIAWKSLEMTALTSVSLTGITLTTQKGDTVISIDQASGHIGLLSLLKRQIVLTRLFLKNSFVDYDRTIHPNLVDIFSKASSPSSKHGAPAWSFAIRSFTIDSLRFHYRDSIGNLTTAGCGNLSGRLSVATEFTMAINARSLSLGITDHSLFLDTCFFSMHNDARRFRCDSVSLQSGSHARIRGAFTIPYGNLVPIAADFSGHADNAFASAINARKWGLDNCDSVSFAVQANGSPARPVVNILAKIHAVSFGQTVAIQRATIHALCDSSGSAKCRVTLDDQSLTGSLNLSTKATSFFSKPFFEWYRIDGDLLVPDVKNLHRVIMKMKSPDFVQSGVARINVSASGVSLKRLPDRLHCLIALSGMSFSNNRIIPDAVLRADVAYDSMTLSGDWPEVLSMNGNGFLVHGTWSGSGAFTVLDARPISELLINREIAGSLKGHFSYSNLFAKPRVGVDLQSSSLVWNNLAITNLAGNFGYEKRSGITINAASAQIRGPLENALRTIGKSGLRGYVTASLVAHGPALYPDATVTLTIDTLGARLPIADRITATVTLHDTTISLDDFHLTKGKALIKGSGSLDRTRRNVALDLSVTSGIKGSGTGTISVRAMIADSNINTATCTAVEVPLDLAHAWLPKIAFPEAKLAVQASMKGKLSNPSATAALQVSDIAFVPTDTKPHFNVSAVLENHQVLALCTLSVSDTCGGGGGPSGPLTASATGAVLPSFLPDTTVPLEIKVLGSDICLRPYAQAFTKAIVMDGSLTVAGAVTFRRGAWTPEGTVTLAAKKFLFPALNLDVENISLTMKPLDNVRNNVIPPVGISLHTGNVRSGNVSLVKTSLQGAFAGNALVIDTAELFFEKGKFFVAGNLPLAPFPALLTHKDFHLTVSADNIASATMNPFVSGGHFSAGAINGRLEFSSGQSAAKNQGSLTADGVVFKIDDLRPAIGPLRCTIRIAGDSVLVNTVGPWGTGTITEQGYITASGSSVGPSQITMNCKGLKIDYLDDSQIRIDSLMAVLSNPQGRWNLNSSVLFGESKVAYEVPFNKPVVARRSTGAPKNPLALNINLILPNSFSTDLKVGNVFTGSASDVHTSIAGSLLITGTTGSPRYAGQLQIDSGTATYLNNVFYIRQGYARLTGGNNINPFIDVVATTTLSELQTNYGRDSIVVTLHISGDLKNPAILLSSNKGFSQIEIISLLTSGSTTFSLAGAGTTAPASILSNSLSSIASRQAQKTLGLEQVQIRGNLFATGSSQSNASVSVSKRISPDVTVTYSRGIADTISQQGVISWKLKPFLFLEFESNDRGNTGIDLKYRIKK